MTRGRSPTYPQIGLEDAVARVAGVYSRDYQRPMTQAALAVRLGYSGLNGKSLAVIGAMRRFGLLEGRGETLRVSDLAARLLAYPEGSVERGEAAQEAARRPALFAALAARFGGGPVEDGAIRGWLVTQGFIPPAAEQALKAYRETTRFLAQLAATAIPVAPPVPASPVAARPPVAGAVPVAVAGPPQGLRRAVFGLAEGEVIITAPIFLSPDSVAELEAYLAVFMRRARREAGLDEG